MSKTILVFGYGPGISAAVADKFGAEGFSVGLVARNQDRLDAGVKALEAKGVKAKAFPADVADPAAIRAVVEDAQKALGPITVIEWTAYGVAAGNLLAADDEAVAGDIGIATTSLLAAVRAVLPDLKAQKGTSAVLVTNGGLGYFDEGMDKMAVAYGSMGLAMANSAKHKLVRMLSHQLGEDGIYVGEVMVLGLVKGTAFDHGGATIDPARISAKFWEIYSARKEISVQLQ